MFSRASLLSPLVKSGCEKFSTIASLQNQRNILRTTERLGLEGLAPWAWSAVGTGTIHARRS